MTVTATTYLPRFPREDEIREFLKIHHEVRYFYVSFKPWIKRVVGFIQHEVLADDDSLTRLVLGILGNIRETEILAGALRECALSQKPCFPKGAKITEFLAAHEKVKEIYEPLTPLISKLSSIFGGKLLSEFSLTFNVSHYLESMVDRGELPGIDHSGENVKNIAQILKDALKECAVRRRARVISPVIFERNLIDDPNIT